ncbi:non-hydrolyzing UDP-N-acetylglucosamine 2-epimerase [Paremcibacter congregatus]|uniref:non-hydrolyzing UDP-N-acetylglucosamine 2-epimerase n=1 Tax=Paremcibacter congregatus TaxID=2043170 RepID=UPI003A8D4B5E
MSNDSQILFCFGSRPELIKLAPVYHNLKSHFNITPRLCDTGQQKDLLAALYQELDMTADIRLSVMKSGQSLDQLIATLTAQLPEVIKRLHPDLVVVQGDTASAFTAAMVAGGQNVAVAHVEAGLRTYDITSPFPEEIYRQGISKIAAWHFCPTEQARLNLLKEGHPENRIFVTGNTVIDMILRQKNTSPPILAGRDGKRPYFLITLHRRESQGEPLRNTLATLMEFAITNPAYDLVMPLHPNPATSTVVQEMLGRHDNIFLIDPLPYPKFVALMSGAFAIITDSGGIQEEAPSLNVPVIVVRTKTERPEGVENGCLRLAGTERATILQELDLLIHDKAHYKSMQTAENPFGDGHAAERIAHHLKDIAESYHT